MKNNKGSTVDQAAAMERYYRFHAIIYNATRWSFLFGRHELIRRVAAMGPRYRILEVGCGTGTNLLSLAKYFPEAKIFGVDIAEPMLRIAAKRLQPYGGRVSLFHEPYHRGIGENAGFDLVVCSYALTMFNPGWDTAISNIAEDLLPGGLFALADFHKTSHTWFRRWMGVNHVRMEGQLLPELCQTFQPRIAEVRNAYIGLWQWLLFVGQKAT